MSAQDAEVTVIGREVLFYGESRGMIKPMLSFEGLVEFSPSG